MRRIISGIILTTALVFLTSCGHTNELANYDLKSKTFHFEDGVAGGAQQVAIDFSTPLGTGTELFSSGGFSAAFDAVEAVSSIASAALSADVVEKLRDAVDMNEMAYYVSEGMERTLTNFYDIRGVESDDEQSMFIVETILTKCQLGSNESGVGVYVEATSRIIDRTTANIVWEYEGANVVPIREGSSSFDQTVNTVSSVIGAAQLANLSKEEIQASVYDAASGAGALIAEQLREDIAEVRTN